MQNSLNKLCSEPQLTIYNLNIYISYVTSYHHYE